MKKIIEDLTARNEILSSKNDELQKQLPGDRDAGLGEAAIMESAAVSSGNKSKSILIEKMHEGAISLDENGIVLYCNLSFAKMMNIAVEDIVGTKFIDYIADSSKEHFNTLFDQGRQSYIMEDVYINMQNNRSFPVLMCINTSWLDNTFMLSIIVTDLTIRNKNQTEIAQLAAIVESSDDAIISKNIDGTIISWNKGSERMFGYTVKEAVGSSITMIIPPEYIHEEAEIVRRIRNNEILHYETVRNKKSGERFYVSITVCPLKDMAGNIIGASKIARDITAQKKLEEELIGKTIQLKNKNIELVKTVRELAFQIEENERGVSELSISANNVKELEALVSHKESILAVLSHDLRSPLTGMIGLADYLKSEFEDMERSEAQHVINLLDESAKKELTMLDNLVEWARIKYAKEAFTPSKLKLQEYVQHAIDALHQTAALKNISLNNEIESYTVVFADQNMLSSILQNLVSNAVKYSNAGGNITIRSRIHQNNIIVEVKDHGTGISEEEMAQIFSPQINSLSEARKENKGAGIGLLLVKEFLAKNNGEIWVESVKGEGSTFYFTLPIRNLKKENV